MQLPGADGFEKMQKIMDNLRINTPTTIAGYEVSVVSDYKDLIKKNMLSGETGVIDCIPGNVIVFEFGDARRRVTIRPSGTEPKLKLYVQWYEDVAGGSVEDAHKQYNRLLDELAQFVRSVEDQLTS